MESRGVGRIELLADLDRPGGWFVVVGGTPQSYVALDDPTYLEFEYVQWLAHVIHLGAEPGLPLGVLHLGGGGLTLPRYVAATRPRSRQRVFEADAALVEAVRRRLPWGCSSGIRVRPVDARAGVASLGAAGVDVVVADVFAGACTPAHLTSVEFVRDVARVLRGGGTYAVNVTDGPGLRFARGQAATLAAVFDSVCLVAEPAVLRGRRFGNLVLVGSSGSLPVAALVRRTAGAAAPARVVAGDALRRFVAGTMPVTDAVAVPSPEPPAGLFPGR